MIKLHISDKGVEEVMASGDPLEMDVNYALWRNIKPLVDALDRDLKNQGAENQKEKPGRGSK